MTKEKSTELIPVNNVNALEVFSKDNGLDPFVEEVKRIVENEEFDITTESGRTKMGSYARKVGSSKQSLIKLAAGLTEDWRAKTAQVNKERDRMAAEMDKIRDTIKVPLDEFNAREKNRVEAHEIAVQSLRNIRETAMETQNIDELAELMGRSSKIMAGREWEEFIDKATVQDNNNQAMISQKIIDREKAEAERLELEELRAAKAKAEKEAREQKLREEAAESARLEAERIAAEEKQRIADEQAAKDAAAREEREREAAAKKKAEDDAAKAEQRAQEALKAKKEAEEKAKQDAIAAEERQKQALADQKAAQEAESKRQAEIEEQKRAEREADKAHRAAINNEALNAIILKGITNEVTAKQLLTAIAKGEIPNITINY